ncbi:MAG: hypothetical protein IKH71_18890 [Oscillospiraceae bacterium]|nr:hypothetical protein [Oscillospiraceae bacterium]
MSETTRSVKLYLTRDLFNSLLSVLEAYEKTETEGFYTDYASKLKNKLMNFARFFEKNNEENVAFYFFPDEAALLIKLLLFYESAIEKPSQDFFEIVKNNRLKNDIIIDDNE